MKNTIIGIIIGAFVIGSVYLVMKNNQLQTDADKSDVEITLPLDTNGR